MKPVFCLSQKDGVIPCVPGFAIFFTGKAFQFATGKFIKFQNVLSTFLFITDKNIQLT